MERERRYCMGKFIFKRKAAKKMSTDSIFRHYFCQRCKGFHLATRKKFKKKREDA
jgi:hypothetical protein